MCVLTLGERMKRGRGECTARLEERAEGCMMRPRASQLSFLKLIHGPQPLSHAEGDPTVTKNQRPGSVQFKMDSPGLM
jgi:hypothetical protein